MIYNNLYQADIPQNEVVSAFIDAMRDNDIITSDTIIPDGKLHRAYVEGDRKGSLNGAYVLHLDSRPSGWAMSFKTGVNFKWTLSGQREPMSEEMRQQIQYAKQVRQQEQDKLNAKAAEKASWIWLKAKPITAQSQHEYLIKKHINPHGARLYKGALVISICDESGEIVNLQFINPDGQKWFLSGGRKKGCYSFFGDPTETILICEGVATGASLYEQTGHYVVVALDAGNLKPVAEVIRKQYPAAEIIIAGDNDEVGRKSSNDAAVACGGKVLIPPVLGMDWNDYANQGGAA